MEPLNQLVGAVWGEIKTGKSTLALTWDKPLVHLDFDQGFHRAEPNFAQFKVTKVPRDQAIESYLVPGVDIITKPYQMPVKWGQTLTGYIDLWNAVVNDLRAAYESPIVKTLCIDTGSVFWNLRTGAQLEKAQQRNPNRTRLQQIEYGEPNSDMRAMLGACRTYNKNLITVHHVGGVYEAKLTAQGVEEVRVGDTYSGWTQTGALVDIVLRTHKLANNGAKPQIDVEILTCGLTLEAEGVKVPNASFDTILSVINSLRESNG